MIRLRKPADAAPILRQDNGPIHWHPVERAERRLRLLVALCGLGAVAAGSVLIAIMAGQA